MVSPRIKQFIKENSNYIEQEDWQGLFFSWYMHWSDKNKFISDKVQLRELFDILKVVFPNIIKDSEEARKEIIYDKMLDYFYDLQNNSTQDSVSDIKTINNLNSRLFFERDDLEKLFRRAAKTLGFEIRFGHHAVIRE